MIDMHVRSHSIYDYRFSNWATEVHNNWIYDDFVEDPHYRKQWISITSLANDERNNDIYLGVGSFSGELLWRFDRETESIESLGYEKIADQYDAKFHRSLELDHDGVLYAATALFHDIDKQFVAEGGRLVSYDTKKDSFEVLGIPIPKIYVQSIALDRTRRVIYGFGLSPEVFWKHDLKSGESTFLAYLGSGVEMAQAHSPVIDDAGRVWGTYGILRAFAMDPGPDSIRLFCYDPDSDSIEFLKHGLPSVDGDKGRIDGAVNGGDGYLYVGTEAGVLARLDPTSGDVKQLGKPCAKRRMAALQRGRDGLLYGIAGDDYDVHVFAYDTEAEKFIGEAPLYDQENGTSPVRIHNMVLTTDMTIYAGENDNNTRPSYLWECRLTTP